MWDGGVDTMEMEGSRGAVERTKLHKNPDN